MPEPRQGLSFVILDRKLKSDILSKKISKPELALLVWIRLNANPYGVATINLQSLKEDWFENSTNINSVNKLMLNLKRKEYLFYPHRSGKSGSFEVRLPGFILPKSGVPTSIKKDIEDEKKHIVEKVDKNTQRLIMPTQRLIKEEETVEQGKKRFFSTMENRGNNTDTEIKK